MRSTTRTLILALTPAALLGGSLALARTGRADTPPAITGADVPMRPMLTLEFAQRVLEAGVAEARRLNAGGAIAVVDDGGHLVCLVRLDGTFPAAAEVATSKATTAAIFRRPTKDFEDAVRSGRNALLAVAPMTPLEGGVPIRIGDTVVGAIGVSGAHSSTEDVQIATAGATGVAAFIAESVTH